MRHNQTISYLTRRFREVGLRPDSRHGQNFLIDMNLQRLLVDAADLSLDDVVLEVGTGTGALTALIADRAAAVITVELDRHLHQLAREELVECANVTMLLQDVLRNKNRFDERVLEAVDTALAEAPQRRFQLVANLPYSIATPVVSNLLSARHTPSKMTVTIQKELAERIAAKPSTKDYGHLSIWVQSQCRVEIVRILPPSVFWPRPKVESAIIQLVLEPERRARIPDRDFFHSFVRSMFFHRRKFLRSVLASAFKKQLTKQQVDEILAEMQFGPDQRAEQLSIEQMLSFCEVVRAKVESSAD